jgi:hypothetical protein
MISSLTLTTILALLLATNVLVTSQVPAIDYPVRFGYVNSISDWSSAQGIAKALGVPGYAPPHKYNYVCLTFWTSLGGPVDTAQVWNNSANYFGTSVFGSSSADIRRNIKKIFNDNGIKLMVSAFGATENPTSSGADATKTALRLADFVNSNNLDGVDIDW